MANPAPPSSHGAAAVEVFCAGKEAFALETPPAPAWSRACASADCVANPAAAGRAVARRREVRALVEGASHARTLIELGPDYARDVGLCATLDAMDRAFGGVSLSRLRPVSPAAPAPS